DGFGLWASACSYEEGTPSPQSTPRTRTGKSAFDVRAAAHDDQNRTHRTRRNHRTALVLSDRCHEGTKVTKISIQKRPSCSSCLRGGMTKPLTSGYSHTTRERRTRRARGDVSIRSQSFIGGHRGHGILIRRG